jgi:hypothetical protein
MIELKQCGVKKMQKIKTLKKVYDLIVFAAAVRPLPRSGSRLHRRPHSGSKHTLF